MDLKMLQPEEGDGQLGNSHRVSQSSGRWMQVHKKELFWVGLTNEFFKANTVSIRWTTQKDT